jgi:hypothetical protein
MLGEMFTRSITGNASHVCATAVAQRLNKIVEKAMMAHLHSHQASSQHLKSPLAKGQFGSLAKSRQRIRLT